MAEQLGDLLAGASGHPVNRPALDAAVMQGQAMAGLRTAQTEDALLNAQRMREEQEASDNLEGALMGAKGPDNQPLFTPSQAHFTATQMKFLHGGAQPALEAWQTAQKINAFSNVNNPGVAPEQRLASDQALNPGANPYQTVGDQVIPRFAPGSQQPGPNVTPDVQQTPVSQANVAEKNAEANLKNQEASNPGAFHPGATLLTPAQVQTRAGMIANGTAPMPSPYEWTKNPKLAADTVTAALQINPNVSQTYEKQISDTVADFSGKGKNGQALTGYRTVDAHVALLKDAAEALQNHDTNALNFVLNHAKLLFGDATPTDANMLPQFIATEGMRALARNGIGTGKDRDELGQKISVMTQGPAQQQETIAEFNKILNGGKKSLEASYNAGTMGRGGNPGVPTFDQVYAGKPFDSSVRQGSATGGGGTGPIGLDEFLKKQGY